MNQQAHFQKFEGEEEDENEDDDDEEDESKTACLNPSLNHLRRFGATLNPFCSGFFRPRRYAFQPCITELIHCR